MPAQFTLCQHAADYIGFLPCRNEDRDQAGARWWRQLVGTHRRLSAVVNNPAIQASEYPDNIDAQIVDCPDQQPDCTEEQQLMVKQLGGCQHIVNQGTALAGWASAYRRSFMVPRTMTIMIGMPQKLSSAR